MASSGGFSRLRAFAATSKKLNCMAAAEPAANREREQQISTRVLLLFLSFSLDAWDEVLVSLVANGGRVCINTYGWMFEERRPLKAKGRRF